MNTRKNYETLNTIFKDNGITFKIYLAKDKTNDLFDDLSNIIVQYDQHSVVTRNMFSYYHCEIDLPHDNVNLRQSRFQNVLRDIFVKYVQPKKDLFTSEIITKEQDIQNDVVFQDLSNKHFFLRTGDRNLHISTRNAQSIDTHDYVKLDLLYTFIKDMNTHYDTNGTFENLFIHDISRLSFSKDTFNGKTFKIIDLKPFNLDDVDFTSVNESNKVYVMRNEKTYGYFEINGIEMGLFHVCNATKHFTTGLSNDYNERVSQNDYYYTKAYFNHNNFYCNSCGVTRTRDQESSTIKGVCESCERYAKESFDIAGLEYTHDFSVLNNTIKNAHHETTLNFLNVANERSPLYMGVELEFDTGEREYSDEYDDEYYDNDDVSYSSKTHNAIAKKFLNTLTPQGNAYAMWDGSLINGFEIATHPATLKSHVSQFNYKDAFAYLKSKGYKSHDAGTCGFHVHLSRRFFGATRKQQYINVGKLAYLMETHWDKFVAFSRRDDNQLERWAPINSFKRRLGDDFSYENIKYALRRTYELTGKYSAINFTHHNTFEIRIFRGTLNYDTFIATLTMIDSLARLVKKLDYEHLTLVEFSDIINYRKTKVVKNYWDTRKGD